MACSAVTTLMVVMPIAAAGFRLMPRSSRKTHSSRLHVQQLARDLVEALLRLAHADLAALDDHVEPRHDLGDLHRTRVVAATSRPSPSDDVVRQACNTKAGGLDAIEHRHHLRPHLTRQQRQHISAAHLVPEGTGLDGEQFVELLAG